MTDPLATASRTRTAVRRLGVVVAAVAVLAACSSGSEAGGRSSTTAPGTTAPGTTAPAATTTAPAVVEAFGGTVDDFYRLPDDIGDGEPGEVVRQMPIEAPQGESGLRIMYRSSDAEGDARLVTGMVYFPDDPAPAGGWPIVAWTHGTSGLAAPCAPSRHPSPPPGYGVKGVRVATDYIGLGPVGELHPYLSAAAEANAVIDGVVAARSLSQVHAGDRWVVAGVSQGGHAALVTNERAAERLPDVKLLGAVALAPGAELGGTYGDALQARVITTMVLLGLAAEDPTVKASDYLSPKVLAASEVIKTGCVQDIIDTMAGLAAADDYFTVDPRTSPVGKAWVAKNDPGQVASSNPLLLVQGGQDILVVPARTAALFKRLCKLGQVVDELDVPTANHDTVTAQSTDQVAAWIQARFAGDPATDAC